MSRPENLRYSKDHEWVRVDEEDGSVVVGITDYAVEQLTDITHIDLPEVGDTFKSGYAFAEIDSVKTVAEIYAPCAGEVVAVNKEYSENENFELIGKDPFGEGWLVRFKPDGEVDASEMLDRAAYDALVEAEEAEQ